jgi:AcrR family transcriptional regulator
MAETVGERAQRPAQDRAERSRRAILDAATPVFLRDGYTPASLNRIIDASGLTKGGFYFHFPSKQALALAVVADHRERWVERVSAAAAPLPRAVDRMFEAPRILARLSTSADSPAGPRKVIEELARDPDLRDELCAGLRFWVEVVASHFAAAQREGDVRADVDPTEFAEVAVSSFTGMQAMSEQLDDGRLAQRVESFIRLMKASVLTEHGREVSATEGGQRDG